MSAPQTPASPEREARIAALLKGAADLHVHSGPSLMPRAVDHIEAIQEAAAAGMSVVLLKDHYYPTMPIAHLLNKHYDLGVKTLGAIVLNNPLGGFNVHAVDYGLKQGARVVWMATAHAQNHIDHDQKDADFKNKFPTNTKKTVTPIGLSLVDGSGKVVDPVKEILDLIAEADAVVSGGHHHISELWAFYEEAKKRGVKRLLLNHPTYVNEASFQDIAHLASMGVKMEHSVCMFIPSTFKLFDAEHLKQVIDAAGVENSLLGSDLGQTNNPTPVEGFRQIIGMLLDLGYSEEDIRKLVSTNARELVGVH